MVTEPDRGLFDRPVFFESNRVWRCYTGGKLLDTFTNPAAAGTDDNFPEDWLASTTRADNGDNQQSPDEGLSRIRGTDFFFIDLLKKFPKDALGANTATEGIGVLCKFLDSAVRLPIQCHPDKAFSRKHYNSDHGKTESWLVLATREINGEKPYLLFGFKPDVTPEQFQTAVLAQDIPTMCACLHKVEPTPGEVYFIPGRLPHAIGPGLLILEVQEPTDFVIQPERQIGKVTLSDKLMWGDLPPENAFTCFDEHGEALDSLLARLRLAPQPKQQLTGGVLESLISENHTDCFQVDKLTVTDGVDFNCTTPWHLAIVTAGSGEIVYDANGAEEKATLQQGDCFFISHKLRTLRYQSSGHTPLTIHLVSRA